MKEKIIQNESEMLDFAKEVSDSIKKNTTIYLVGDLGAGKTTFSRGFIQARGYTGIVKSPTFTILESYDCDIPVYHFDFYRIEDPEELEYIGFRDYIKSGICLYEWPQKGEGMIDKADLTIEFKILENNTRKVIIT